jgi:WD40 repeat protein
VLLLDASSAEPLTDRVAHSNEAGFAAYSPDGNMFVTFGADGRVVLWDGDSGAMLGSVTPAGTDIGVAAGFAPDGKTVRIVSNDGEVFVWDLDVDTWLEAACTIAGRDLDREEWAEAFATRPYRATCEI